MRKTFEFFTRPLTTKRFDDRFAQVACYAVSLYILVYGIHKVCRLGLDEARLLLGLLLVLCVTFLGIIFGTLAGPSVTTRRFDNRFAQITCYAASMLMLVFGILKLGRLGLDETSLLFGLLLVLSLTMLGIIGGTLAEPSEQAT